MNVPTPEQIKQEAGLPKTANFHGWLIHNPEKDDFLLKAKDKNAFMTSAWCLTPESAKRYNRFARAFKALNDLELQDRAIIVAAFDVGRQIVVIAPDAFKERLLCESNNPFRSSQIKY